MPDAKQTNMGQRETFRSLELPSVPTPVSALLSLKQCSADRLSAIVTAHDASLVRGEQGKTSAFDLWGAWSVDEELKEVRGLSDVEKEQEPPAEKSEGCSVRRQQLEWCETKTTGGEILCAEASRVLRRMKGLNAKVLLLAKKSEVPDVFDGDWVRPFVEETLCCGAQGGGLQQLLLPSEVVMEDDARLARAPDKIRSMARKYLQELQCTDVLFVKASMNVPSVWNCEVVVDSLADMVTEKLTLHTPQELSEPASVPSRVLPEQNERDCLDSDVNDKIHPATSAKVTPSRITENGIEDELNLAIRDEVEPPSTDYFLSDSFLRCNWSEPSQRAITEAVTTGKNTSSNISKDSSKYQQLLHQFARPSFWDLARKKLLQVDRASFQNALNRISLEALEAIICQQFRIVKAMSLNPSASSSSEIMEACASLRQAAWLHTLRIVSIGEMAAARNGGITSAILTKILPSAKYKLVLGVSNWRDLHNLLEVMGANTKPPTPAMEPAEEETTNCILEENAAILPPLKKQRVLQQEQEATPVRVMCSVQFLENDDLLDELCTEQRVFFIERDLPPPIDILIDEKNCICVLDGGIFQVEAKMRSFVFSLARLQVQFQKCWIIIALGALSNTAMEETMSLFYAALVQFRVEMQVLTSFSYEETGQYVRAIVDECAEVALNRHRILPRMWFERPFLLEEESQFERFLVSTNVINHYSAQSLLHKFSMEDLFTTCIDDLKPVVQNALSDEQLELLWGLLHQNHGLNVAIA